MPCFEHKNINLPPLLIKKDKKKLCACKLVQSGSHIYILLEQ